MLAANRAREVAIRKQSRRDGLQFIEGAHGYSETATREHPR